MDNRAKSVLLIHIGTACRLKGEIRSDLRLQFCRGAGSRTRVTVFAGFASYRFFSSLPPDCLRALAIRQCCSSWDLHPQTSLRGSSADRLLHHSSGGHAGAAAQNSSRRVLLPLRGIAFKYRVREDVRFEEIRVALVGEHLRQTPHANASQ